MHTMENKNNNFNNENEKELAGKLSRRFIIFIIFGILATLPISIYILSYLLDYYIDMVSIILNSIRIFDLGIFESSVLLSDIFIIPWVLSFLALRSLIKKAKEINYVGDILKKRMTLFGDISLFLLVPSVIIISFIFLGVFIAIVLIGLATN